MSPCRGLLGSLALLLLASPVFAAGGDEGLVVPLKVIYAGDPDTDHTRAFQAFLTKRCKSLKTIPVLDLAAADLSGADVLIVDGRVLLRDDRGQPKGARSGPTGLSLEKLQIPTVLIGGMGGRVADALKLKLGWQYG